VVKAEASFDATTKEPIVVIYMSPRSGRMFHELTTKNLGRRLLLRIDGEVVMEPVIREPVMGGSVQVSGNFTIAEVTRLAERLSNGEAKVEVELAD
jgi:preprotein translocase subunit SecD